MTDPHTIECQRILDSAARRLLAEEFDGDSFQPATGQDTRSHRGSDQPSALGQGKPIPIGNRNRQRGDEAA